MWSLLEEVPDSQGRESMLECTRLSQSEPSVACPRQPCKKLKCPLAQKPSEMSWLLETQGNGIQSRERSHGQRQYPCPIPTHPLTTNGRHGHTEQMCVTWGRHASRVTESLFSCRFLFLFPLGLSSHTLHTVCFSTSLRQGSLSSRTSSHQLG